ncbi:MAG: zinc ribbon domain-containing protein [Chloroflexota bacterium]
MVNPQTAFMWAAVYGGVMLAVAWLAMVIWAYRDMRARSRDAWAQLLAAAVVLLLNLPGLVIYIFLRPRETLSEAYERSLEEEALLQEIEDKPVCPGCAQRVDAEWQACPYCHTRLKKPCINCSKMLQLSWDLCPHCAVPQTSGALVGDRGHVTRDVRVAPTPPDTLPDVAWSGQSGFDYTENNANDLEFIDEDYRR